jgi:hypothetical protein
LHGGQGQFGYIQIHSASYRKDQEVCETRAKQKNEWEWGCQARFKRSWVAKAVAAERVVAGRNKLTSVAKQTDEEANRRRY